MIQPGGSVCAAEVIAVIVCTENLDSMESCTYNLLVQIEFDPAKNERNVRERGLSFERARDFEFESAVFAIDDRQPYGETRIRAFGRLDGRLHALVFVETESGIRVISFRKANAREVKRYEQAS